MTHNFPPKLRQMRIAAMTRIRSRVLDLGRDPRGTRAQHDATFLPKAGVDKPWQIPRGRPGAKRHLRVGDGLAAVPALQARARRCSKRCARDKALGPEKR